MRGHTDIAYKVALIVLPDAHEGDPVRVQMLCEVGSVGVDELKLLAVSFQLDAQGRCANLVGLRAVWNLCASVAACRGGVDCMHLWFFVGLAILIQLLHLQLLAISRPHRLGSLAKDLPEEALVSTGCPYAFDALVGECGQRLIDTLGLRVDFTDLPARAVKPKVQAVFVGVRERVAVAHEQRRFAAAHRVDGDPCPQIGARNSW
mmetsp:Transcript_73608/g.162770  ORF Transcript_73608/g.162770 Transcript_73608/m.162770 type:complete len:205 (-) Transcript_73608:998-1612(-)